MITHRKLWYFAGATLLAAAAIGTAIGSMENVPGQTERPDFRPLESGSMLAPLLCLFGLTYRGEPFDNVGDRWFKS